MFIHPLITSLGDRIQDSIEKKKILCCFFRAVPKILVWEFGGWEKGPLENFGLGLDPLNYWPKLKMKILLNDLIFRVSSNITVLLQ